MEPNGGATIEDDVAALELVYPLDIFLLVIDQITIGFLKALFHLSLGGWNDLLRFLVA